MRANKCALIWAFCITVSSFLVALYLHSQEKSFIYDISLACFGSALLAIVVAYSAYNAERRDTMEQFWNGTLEAINQLKKIPHFELQEPIDIIKNALFEDDNWFDCEYEKRNQLFDWIESRYPMDENVEKEELQKLIEAQCQAILENAKANLLKTAEAFVSFANMNISEMENAYGKMDFIIANDSIRLRAYKKIYDRIRRFKIECKKERSHFELLKRGNGNVSICFDKVIELDRVLYRTEKGNMGHSVYAYMVDELLDELEVFRSMIYHVEPEREEAIPVSMMIDFEKPGTIETIKERKEKQLQEGLTEKAEKQTVV